MDWLRHMFALLALLWTTPAPPPADMALCNKSPDKGAIAACTHRIQSGQLTGDDLAGAYFRRGFAYQKARQPAPAIADYSRAIGLQPKFDSALFYRGLLFLEAHDSEKALADLNRVIALSPKAFEPYVFAATLYDERDQHGRAMQAYAQAIALAPAEAGIHVMRAVSQEQAGEFPAALADLNKALALKPDMPAALAMRGSVRRHLGDSDAGVADLDRAVQLAPRDEPVLNERCWNNAVLKRNLKQALQDCDAAIRARPDRASPHDSCAFVYYQSGRFADAVAEYDRALALDPRHASAFYGRGVAKRRLGDRAGSDKDIAAALALAPGIGRTLAYDGFKP